jgi:DegV family protein with EDD domain
MMTIQLMTDGGADIPASLKESIDVEIVPLYLHFSDEEFKSEGNKNVFAFYDKLEKQKELPRSAAPSPHDFYKAYKKVEATKPIIMFNMSAGLSSTYENAVAGKNMLLEEEPDRRIEVMNTKTASCGIALLLDEASKKIKENVSFEQLTAHLHQRIQQTTSLFVLQTLDNLILGGRLDKVRGKIANTLNIKLLMRGNEEGMIEVTEKVRGEKRAVRRFVDQIANYTKSPKDKTIFISHGNDEPRAKTILSTIRNKFPFKDSYVTEMGPLIFTYGGNGAIVISFFSD